MSLRLVCISVLTVLVGCSSNSAYYPATPLDENFQPEVNLQRNWFYHFQESNFPIRLPLIPVVVSDQVFAVTDQGRVHGLDVKTGKANISWQIGEAISSGLSTDGSYLYTGTNNADLISMDLLGTERWRAKLTSRVLSLPAFTNDFVFVQSQDGYLAALDRKSGQQVWIYDSGNPRLTMFGDASPVVVDKQVIASFASGKIVGFEIITGRVLWSQNLGKNSGRTDLERINDSDATPVVVNKNMVFGNSYQEEILLISLETGLPVKRYKFGSRHSVLPFPNELIILANDDVLISLNPENGEIKWKNESFQYRKLSKPVSWQGYIAFGDSLGWLHLVDPITGKAISRYDSDHLGIAGSPVVVGEQLLVQGESGRLKSFSILEASVK